MGELIHFRGSPWSLKVVWALHSMGLQKSLAFTEYNFPIGMLGLKYRLGQWSGNITIPIFFDTQDGKTYRESFDIVNRCSNVVAEAGTGNVLIPAQEHSSIKKWNEHADYLLRYGRSNPYGDDVTPYLVPRLLHYIPGSLSAISYLQTKYMKSKYGEGDEATNFENIESILAEANTRLSESQFLVGDKFSYADISFACSLECYSPENLSRALSVASCTVKLHEALKPVLAKYPKLLPWKKFILDSYYPSTVDKDVLVPLSIPIVPISFS